MTVPDGVVGVEVDEPDGGEFSGRAARPRIHRLGLAKHVCVRVFGHEDVRAVAGAVVDVVVFRGNDPVPFVLLKVNDEREATAQSFCVVILTFQAL